MFAHVVRAIGPFLTLLSMRLLPFAVYLALSPTRSRQQRVLLTATCLMVPVSACFLGQRRSLILLVVGLSYYLMASLGANRLSRLLANGRLTPGAVLVVVFFAFALLPGVALPSFAMSTFLVVGCDLVLKTYSYCIETSRVGARVATRADCLFFLFVNPTLLYARRGTRLPVPCGVAGWQRAGAGAAIMFADFALILPFTDYLASGTALAWLTRGGPLTTLLYGVTRFFAIYAAHSSLASIDIGLMLQAGWRVPERYRYPLLSAGPMDFWRRWNTYVRVWLEAYVFLPLAMRAARKTKHAAGQVAAAVATLVSSALIHDAFSFAGRQRLADLATQTEFFLAAGLLLGLWRVGGALVDLLRTKLNPQRLGRLDVAVRLSGRFAFLAALIAASIAWA